MCKHTNTEQPAKNNELGFQRPYMYQGTYEDFLPTRPQGYLLGLIRIPCPTPLTFPFSQGLRELESVPFSWALVPPTL